MQARWDGSSKIAMVRMLWQLRSAGLRVAGERNLKGFIWPKKLVLQRVAIVQCQLAQWYQDPYCRFDHRYWDGAWTEHVSLGGVPGIDPPVAGPVLSERTLAPMANLLAERTSRTTEG